MARKGLVIIMKPLELKKKIISNAKELESFVIDIRRHIHMYPETAYEEEKTAKYIEDKLKEIGLNTQRVAKTGVMATLKGNYEGKTVCLRADIDALDIIEENVEKPYCSKIPGKMHACGHDGHAAMLLGAAKILANHQNHLKGTVKLIFQPAEEGGGGAKRIIEQGHINEVDVIFGIHLWHEVPSGVIQTRKGGMMASLDEFTIKIDGKGGHAAAPWQTIDPTAVLVDIYNALQKVISRELNPFKTAIISAPVMVASDAFNVIPSQALLRGTFRAHDVKIRDYLIQRMSKIVEGYCEAWRCSGNIFFNEGDKVAYPPLINDHEAVDELTEILKELDSVGTLDPPTMGGEDFAFYLQKLKGAFIALGINNENQGIVYPHHNPKFDIDEAILWKGAAIYALLGFYSSFIR